MKRFFKIVSISILVLLVVLAVSAYLLTQSKVQTRLAKEAATWLSNKLDTKVSIQKVRIDFLDYVHFQGLYIEDQQQDTLAYIHDFQIRSSSIVVDLWNDRTSIIRNVKLKGGVVNMRRAADSNRWNFTFIEEAFANDDKDSTKNDPPKLDLKNVSVQHVRFSMIDKWGGQDIAATVGTMTLKVNSIDVPNLMFSVQSISLENSDVVFKEYKGGKPQVTNKKPDPKNWGTPFNPDSLALRLDELKFANVNFEYQKNGHTSIARRFDEQHIVANNLHLDIENLKLQGDTITAEILNLSVAERSGFVIKKLKTKFTLNQQLAELDDLYLETNHSVLKNYYSMSYSNFHDFKDYIESVTMKGQFNDSRVDKRDIAFFAGDVSQLPAVTYIDGRAQGTVANLYLPKVKLHSPNLQYEGSARIIGLPDIDNTYFKLAADKLVTNGNEIIRLAPGANAGGIQWSKLSSINFKGNFEGSVKKFKADGLLVSNQGNVDLDIFLNLLTPQPTYNGKFTALNLNLGEILGEPDMGKLTAKGSIEGSSFDLDYLKAKIDAYVEEFYFQGERYEQVALKGSVVDKEFTGSAVSKDPRLGLDFTGKVNLKGENATYDFKSDIRKVNLKALGITNEDVFMNAKVVLDFKGNNIDNFVGKAILQDVNLLYNNQTITIPSVRLNSYYNDSLGKVLDLKSSVGDARVVGRYSITGIDKTIRSFLHYYMPTFINETALPNNEVYKFDVLVKNANPIINIFEPKLKIDSGSTIYGDINTSTQSLNLTGLFPNIIYDGLRLHAVGMESKGTRQLFTSAIVADKVWIRKSQIIDNAKLDISMSSDTARVTLATQPLNDFLGESVLDFRAQAFIDRVVIDIKPSSFIIKDDKYRLSSDYPIKITNESIITMQDVLIENGTQQFVINSTYDGITNDALIDLSSIDLDKISKYFNLKDFTVKGRTNADVAIKDIWGDTKISGHINSIDELILNTDTLGRAGMAFNYDKNKNELLIEKGSRIEYKKAFVETNGNLNFEKETLNMTANLQQMPIGFANKFMEALVDSLKGYATGVVSVKGAFDNPVIEGDMALKESSLRVKFTGCKYSFADFEVKLNNKSITFDPITIFDERVNRGTALLTGKITHENYDTYRLKLNVTSDDLLALNTNELSDELFYGYIPAKFDMSITGAIDDILMDIAARPLEGSKFYMPLNSSTDAAAYDYITFRTLGRFQEEEKITLQKNNYFRMNMDIEATPDVLATIILDANTREKIEARGNGNIKLKVDLGNEIQMYNSFVVKEGVYQFNFRGLLAKDFQLEEGGTITWNGDALNALLDMKAIYKTNLSLYPLLTTNQDGIASGSGSDAARRKEETHVIIDLSGPLSSPNIVFDIQQPFNRDIGTEGLAKLQQIRQDQNELIYQAGMILLFNSFKPTGGGLNAGSLASTTVSSTASDMVSSALSPVINNVINKLTGTQNFNLNLGYKNYSQDISAAGNLSQRSQVDLDLTASLFQDRFILELGNSLDFANNAPANTNGFNYAGDFRGQYLLSADGRYRLNGFRVSSFDYAKAREVARGGIGIIYKRSFNSWNEIFSPNKNNASQKEPSKPESDNKVGAIKNEEPSVTTTLELLNKWRLPI